MTLFVPQWATNLNYSTGPDSGTPTKVDPSSTPNGFVAGVIAAPQHVNYLVHGLSAEIVKAIDGIGGGTYTLGSPLQFMGADVRIGADLEVLGTGQINVQNGAEINVLNGGRVDIESGAGLHLDPGSDLDLDGPVDLDAGAVFTVHGEVALATSGSGELSVASGAIINVNSGGRVDLNTGSEMNVEGTAHIDVEGSIEVTTGTVNVASATGVTLLSGGRLNAQSGSQILTQAGAIVRIEDAEDLTINDSAEGFRTTLVPFGYITTGWAARLTSELVWEQIDTGSDWRIVFPLAVPPGDTLINVFVAVNGENGHGGVIGTLTRPVVQIVRPGVDGTIGTPLATRTDQSVDLTAYETPHFILLQSGSLDSGSMPILATDEPLYVIVSGETGANAIAGLEIGSITGNVTARSYRGALAIYS